MSKASGRPMKYYRVLNSLLDHTLYTPATIAAYAEERQLLPPSQVDAQKKRRRLRMAMARLSNYHAFPDQGDGTVTRPGQRPAPAWYGWRWKLILEGNYDVYQQENG